MIKRYLPTLAFSIAVLVIFTCIRHVIWNAHFDFHQLDTASHGKYTFLVVHKGRPEEKEYATRLIRAARTLEWNGYEVSLTPPRWIRKLPFQPFAHIVKKVSPHFILSMTKQLPAHESRPHYLLLSDREYNNIENHPQRFHPQEWDGILSSSALISKLHNLYPSLPSCLPWYWSSPSTKYYQPCPRRLLELIATDGYVSSSFHKLRSLLNRSGYLDLNSSQQDLTEHMEAIHKAGIALVLHSEHQFADEVPSHYFFDAIASSAVVIADRHPFIEKEFQDCVLYIDREHSSEELFQNIDGLMEWIWHHQEEATALAKKAHTIFHERFTIQKLLQDLENLHTGSVAKFG